METPLLTHAQAHAIRTSILYQGSFLTLDQKKDLQHLCSENKLTRNEASDLIQFFYQYHDMKTGEWLEVDDPRLSKYQTHLSDLIDSLIKKYV